MKKALVLGIILFLSMNMSAQTVSGRFPMLSGQSIKLIGFSSFDNYTIDSVIADTNGQFTLNFDEKDCGMGVLVAANGGSYVVVLAHGENLQLEGKDLAIADGVEVVAGEENRLFAKYAEEHPLREQALNAWRYLEKMYVQDALFSNNDAARETILSEEKRIKEEDLRFVENLPPDYYLKWYLPLRKLIASAATVAQYQTDEIPNTISAFRSIDYADTRLLKSGLLADLIDTHFWLIENSGASLDSVFAEMNVSIDRLVDNLEHDEEKLNGITAYLFKLLEKRSLSKASEHLALRLLNEQGCTLDDNLAAQLECYRAMKTGSLAPDFDFKVDVIAKNHEPVPQRLSDLKSKSSIVIFGASWCPQCPQELLKLAKLYDKLKSLDMEVVFVSLDEEASTFRSFCEIFPFISVCDYQKWESQPVKDYHIFATPTLYLLNDKREILLRPNSVAQLDAWIDRYMTPK